MEEPTLACQLELHPVNSEEFALKFSVSNPSTRPAAVGYFEPYLDFDLKAYADDGEVPLIQPAYDGGVRPVKATIAPGETLRIETTIRLRFDPDVGPSGGNVPTLWTLRHAPAPVRLRATMRLGGAAVAPCETRLVPRA
jgi:hypothetical protein